MRTFWFAWTNLATGNVTTGRVTGPRDLDTVVAPDQPIPLDQLVHLAHDLDAAVSDAWHSAVIGTAASATGRTHHLVLVRTA